MVPPALRASMVPRLFIQRVDIGALVVRATVQGYIPGKQVSTLQALVRNALIVVVSVFCTHRGFLAPVGYASVGPVSRCPRVHGLGAVVEFVVQSQILRLSFRAATRRL